MKVKLTVTSETKTYELICLIHSSKDTSSRRLSEEFYLNGGKNEKLPIGLHHEIEILSPNPAEYPHFEKLHIHYSKNKKPFVCIIWPMSTITHTLKILEMWAAGSIYTITTGESFQNLFTNEEAKNEDFNRVLQVLRTDYSIVATIENI